MRVCSSLVCVLGAEWVWQLFLLVSIEGSAVYRGLAGEVLDMDELCAFVVCSDCNVILWIYAQRVWVTTLDVMALAAVCVVATVRRQFLSALSFWHCLIPEREYFRFLFPCFLLFRSTLHPRT